MLVPFPVFIVPNKKPNLVTMGQVERHKMTAMGNITTFRIAPKAFVKLHSPFSKRGVKCIYKLALFT